MILQRTLGPVSSPQNPEDIANKAYVDNRTYRHVFPVVSQQSANYSWYAMFWGRNYATSLNDIGVLDQSITLTRWGFTYRGENSGLPIGSGVSFQFTLNERRTSGDSVIGTSSGTLGNFQYISAETIDLPFRESIPNGAAVGYYWRLETSGAVAPLGTVEFTVMLEYAI